MSATHPVIVQLTVEDTTAHVSMQNEGPEIPLEEQARLWERFYRVKGGATHQELNLDLGLDLYLCRALIELHNGNVGVHSAPGQGTSFWFTLPIAQSTEGEHAR